MDDKDNYMKNAELSTEQNYNMIDGIPNNAALPVPPSVPVPEVKPLTEVEFYSMMEHILSLPESKTAVVFAVTNHEKAIPLEVE